MNDSKADAAYHPDQPPGGTMTTNIERAIEILEDEHDPFAGLIDAPSLVYALNDAGLITSDLVPYSDGNAEYAAWHVENITVTAYPGNRTVYSGGDPLTPKDAREEAAALLAAANHAEKETK